MKRMTAAILMLCVLAGLVLIPGVSSADTVYATVRDTVRISSGPGDQYGELPDLKLYRGAARHRQRKCSNSTMGFVDCRRIITTCNCRLNLCFRFTFEYRFEVASIINRSVIHKGNNCAVSLNANSICTAYTVNVRCGCGLDHYCAFSLNTECCSICSSATDFFATSECECHVVRKI